MGKQNLTYIPLVFLVAFGINPVLAEQSEKSVVEKIVDVQHDLFNGPREGLRDRKSVV